MSRRTHWAPGGAAGDCWLHWKKRSWERSGEVPWPGSQRLGQDQKLEVRDDFCFCWLSLLELILCVVLVVRSWIATEVLLKCLNVWWQWSWLYVRTGEFVVTCAELVVVIRLEESYTFSIISSAFPGGDGGLLDPASPFPGLDVGWKT